VSVREATRDDVALLVEMRLALEREGGSGAAADPDFRRSVGTWFEEHVGTRSFRAWIAQEDGEAVAVGGLVLVSRPPYTGNRSGIEGLVTSMYTVPERRGRGIGARLLETIVTAARNLGAGRLILYSSRGAESLYRRFGFTDDVERGAPLHLWLNDAAPEPSGS
jgi:GNAT superfamily N-acetyltransferase